MRFQVWMGVFAVCQAGYKPNGMSADVLSWCLLCFGFVQAAKLLVKMDTDEARAERLVEELCQIPLDKLGGVLYVLEDLIKKIRDDACSQSGN